MSQAGMPITMFLKAIEKEQREAQRLFRDPKSENLLIQNLREQNSTNVAH